ncbi:tRNA 2-thiouridine(34) synthase MnmA, partial [candidate division WOR-3 bacterium]|nr:tRNA 2-thiouridine(34) synthase MnmA [candidate division WOR-3 bacterium]
IEVRNTETYIKFSKPQMAITPGQLAVFYDNDVVLGSGWIVDER